MSVGRRVAAVAAAFLLAPGSALAADPGAPLQVVTDAVPVAVPEVTVPEPTVPVAVPTAATPVADTALEVVPSVRRSAETAPIVQVSPQLDAAPASRAPARAVRPQPSTERTARVAVASPRPVGTKRSVVAPASGTRLVERSHARRSPVVDAPLRPPLVPNVPSAATFGSTSAGASILAFVGLLAAIVLLAVPELGARAPLAPLLRRRFHVLSLLERPG
jgi:hypothetical protein